MQPRAALGPWANESRIGLSRSAPRRQRQFTLETDDLKQLVVEQDEDSFLLGRALSHPRCHIIRLHANLILLQHTESARCSGVTVIPSGSLDTKQTEAIATFLVFCSDRPPPEPDKPPRTEVDQKIAELEYRLEHLRKALESAAAF